MNGNPTKPVIVDAINCTHVQKPCPDCPFSRTVKPGALGGSSPLVYIGQAAGPYILPCHKHVDFEDPDWKAKCIQTPQCAGAAIFRANTRQDRRLPEAIHRLPQDHVTVFSTSAEFLSHHLGVPLGDAVAFLKVHPPEELLALQMERNTNMHWAVSK